MTKKIVTYVKQYIVDTGAPLLIINPTFAAIEIFFSQMSIAASINARIRSLIVVFLGIGILFAKGRDYSRAIFGLSDTSSEFNQSLHDGLYNVLFSSFVGILIYVGSGASLLQGFLATAGSVVLSFFLGPLSGFSIDLFRDLTGLRASGRIPVWIGKLSSPMKLALAFGIVLMTVILTVGVYMLSLFF